MALFGPVRCVRGDQAHLETSQPLDPRGFVRLRPVLCVVGFAFFLKRPLLVVGALTALALLLPTANPTLDAWYYAACLDAHY